MIVRAIKWIGGINGCLEIIDQRKLPAEFVKLRCSDTETLYDAIKTLAVRGAPAIGVAGAYGLVLALRNCRSVKQCLSKLVEARDYLASCRPTAVNLSWALNRVAQKALESRIDNIDRLRKVVLDEANAVCREDIKMCRRIGANGCKLIKNGAGVLTHCNAGALATAGQGTALSVLYEAQKKGRRFKVYADETRPLLQGARLTAWELQQAGIDVTIICDNMAGVLMKQGKINLVITGADRIAANGDTANKIGTYGVSVLAKHHKIPFYIAAPSSTFDLTIRNGKAIPIEQRSPEEVRLCGSKQTTPNGVDIYNPAFDVTPAQNITAIITERGLIEQPSTRRIARHLR